MTHKKITLGILNADEFTTEVEDEFGSYDDMFKSLFIDGYFEFKFYQLTKNVFPKNINECDAYLITGSKFSANENLDWIIKLKELIKDLYKSNTKLIGICFGHQLIAAALGGKVSKNSNGWGVGVMYSEVIHYRSWMEPNITTFALFVSHQDQVETLPIQAVRIATNDFCVNSGFQINDTILTFQGHPEFTKEYLLQIMNKRRSVIGEAAYLKAADSLNNNTDTAIIVKWIENFLLN